MLGEWIGGLLLIAIMSLLIWLTYPAKLVQAARTHPEPGTTHMHADGAEAPLTLRQKLARRETWQAVASAFVMDWKMLWKDIALGFLIAGALATFVPASLWQTLFIKGTAPWLQVPANALLGPLVAVISFVCSIGNVPMAAVLWGAGVSFGGVLAFLYADLIVLPLLDVYRRYYGWKMAAYIAALFYTTMVLAALMMDAAFTTLGLIPHPIPHQQAVMTHFAFNYSFYLNVAFALMALALFIIARTQKSPAPRCEHHAHAQKH